MNGIKSSPCNMPYLPDDLLLNILGRVSRLYYPILSLVSKRFRSLVGSLELYKIRTLLGRRTENCLYLSLRFSYGSNPRWFTLCRRPTRTPSPEPNLKSRWFTSCFRPILTNLTRATSKEEKKLSENLMVSIPTSNDCPLSGLTCNTIGSYIYMIGGYINGVLSSRVFFLDCRSHTWHEAPSMQVARKSPLVNVLDGKIYVVEGWRGSDYSNLIEIFDPKTQKWEHVPSPSAEMRGRYISKGLVYEEKLYLFGDKNVVYKPKESRWDALGFDMNLWLVSYGSSCVIDNVCYMVFYKRLIWYDSEVRYWRVLKGLEKLPKLRHRRSCIRMVDYGGKIAILWEKKVRVVGSDKKMIWCTEIALERRSAHKIYGKIEWCDVVLTVPKSCSLLEFIAVTI